MTEEEIHRRLSNNQLIARYTRIIKAAERSWHDWIDIGKEIALRRIEAKIAANKTTRGKTYSARLREGLGAFLPIYLKINGNSTLAALDDCLGQLAMVNAFRLSLPEHQRPVHPVTVWRQFKASSFAPFYDSHDDNIETNQPEPRQAIALSSDQEKSKVSRKLKRGKPRQDQDRMTDIPDINASRILLSLIEQLGRGRRTLEIALDTGRALIQMAQTHLDKDADE